MAYIGNIGTLLKSIYVRDKLPAKKRADRKIKKVKYGRNTSKFTYAGTAVSYKGRDLTPADRLLEIRNKYRDEIRMHGEQVSFKEGFVYLISNDAFPGWVKAGMTIDYENRLSQYNVYDPVNGYKMHTVKWVNNRRDKESLLLNAIEDRSQSRKGEWFFIDKEQAITIFMTI
jgi:hypothetical protein